MQVSTDTFAVRIKFNYWLSATRLDYELELIDIQSSDATRVAFRDKTILDFNKYVFQWHLSIWKAICLLTQACFEAPAEAQQKQHTESTGTTVWCLRLLYELASLENDSGTNGSHSLKNPTITLSIDAMVFAALSGKYGVNKILWAYSLLRQHRLSFESW